MTHLESIEFETKEKLMAAIDAVLEGKDAFRSYNSNGETKNIKIISNNRLYLGNNYSLSITKSPNNGKIYLSIDYLAVDDRIRIAKLNNSSETTPTTNVL